MKTGYIYAVICVLVIVLGQMVMKYLGVRTTSIWDVFNDPKLAAILAAAMTMYAASTLLWIVALREIPLSRAYMIMAMAFVLVPLLSHFVFNEDIPMTQITGIGLVVVGIYLSTAVN